MDKQWVEKVVDQPTVQDIQKRHFGPRKRNPVLNMADRQFNGRFCLCDCLGRLLRGWCSKQCDIVFRHYNTHAAAIPHVLFLTQLSQIFACVPNAFSAGQDKIYILVPCECCVLDPFLHNTRDPPCVGWGDDDQGTFRMDVREIVISYLFKEVGHLIANRVSDSFCYIGTVSGSRKI